MRPIRRRAGVGWIVLLIAPCRAAAPFQQVPGPPPPAIPEDFRYDPAGRRDPFVNPVPVAPPAPEQPEDPAGAPVRPGGLSGVPLAEARVAGVVTSADAAMNAALILAPGGATFIARPGDSLLDAVVAGIRSDAVVFRRGAPADGSRPRAGEEVVRPVGGVTPDGP